MTDLVFTFFFLKKYQNHFEFSRVVRSPRLKKLEIHGGRRGWGGHQRLPGMENPRGSGVQIKESSV